MVKKKSKKIISTSKKPVQKVKRKKKGLNVLSVKKKKKYKLSTEERYLDLFSRGIFGKSLKQFHGVSLQEYYKGEWIKNEFGEVYIATYEDDYLINPVDHCRVDEKLMNDLKAIPGIAEITETNLKKEGFKTINDLTRHFKYKPQAETYVQNITERNGLKLYNQLSSRFTSTNPALLYNSTYFNLEDVAFIDIETMGLHDCPLFLIGVATFEGGKIKVTQIFIEYLLYEKAGLDYLFENIKHKKAIFTYNGKTFDVPFMRKRLIRHDLKHQIDFPHFDIKFFSMKAFKETVGSFELQTLENELLQFKRKDDVPGRLVPQFYESYLKSKNIGAVVPILNHNKQDLISTIKIYHKLHEIWIN